jgi:hypothetical protein
MKLSYVGSAIIGVALLSCATPTENELPAVELLTDRTTYVMEDWVVLTLTNRGAHSIVYDFDCTLAIQRMVGTSWESVDTGPRACIAMLRSNPTLAPGASVAQRFQVVAPAFGSVREYRFRLSVVDPRSLQSFVVSSNSFTVERW